MAALALKTTPWLNTFPGAPPLPSAKCILVCIPHAGGTTMSYRCWQKSLPDVLIAAVALPGRMRRAGETPFRDMKQLVPPLCDALLASGAVSGSTPWAVFGHSMGSAVAYEVCLELQRRSSSGHAHSVQPFLIIGSGSRPPSWRAEHRVVSKSDPTVTKCEPDLIHLLDDDAFIRHLAELGGTSAEVLANRELMEFCLPFLRADFELINTYQPSALTAADGVSPPLSSPLLVLGGRDDAGCPPQAREDWARITTSTTEVHVFDGGHFFIDQADTNGAMLQISGKLELLTTGAAQ